MHCPAKHRGQSGGHWSLRANHALDNKRVVLGVAVRKEGEDGRGEVSLTGK